MNSRGLTGKDNGYRQLLSIGSLFKDVFSIDWLMELMSVKRPSQILGPLEHAVQEGWLTERGPGSYSFANAKKRSDFKKHLSEKKEKQLHSEIANILIRDLSENEGKSHAVAYHLMNISNDLERCRHLITAGDHHLKSFRTEDALKCYSKVIEELSKVKGVEAARIFSSTAIKYSKISTARHDTASVISILQSAEKRAEKWGMERSRALLKMHMAKNEWLRSRHKSALKHFEEGWAIAEKLNDPKLTRSATTFSTFFLFWQGRYREAVRMYEKSIPDIENFPEGGFSLLAAITVGRCYAEIGQVTQGLGMLDAIRNKCLERGNLYLAAFPGTLIGSILLNIGHVDEGIHLLEKEITQAKEVNNDWVWITGKKILAYAYYLKGDKKRTLTHLREFLKQSSKVKVTVYLYPYLMELALAMKRGDLSPLKEISLEKLIQSMKKGKNIYLKGAAYRYEALLRQVAGDPQDAIIKSLKKSITLLQESGHQIELSKSKLALAKELFKGEQMEKAKALTLEASTPFTNFNRALIPEELRILVKDKDTGQNLLKEILKLGQEVVTIRDNRDLAHHIISEVNKITGAERGVILLFDEDSASPKLHLRASKNLTLEQIKDDKFASSMEMIRQVARTGEGKILGMSSRKILGALAHQVIRSRICVPMILRDKIVGALYHDNRLLSSAFKDSDIELLSYFAALAAIALDNASAYEEIKRLNKKFSEETQYYREEHHQNLRFDNIVGKTPAIKQVFSQVELVAPTDTTVLIMGETGVGKELFAGAIHQHSVRKDKPFIRVHCSALPESLIASELFGHEKGAFTGANRRRRGRFELADGGTLFLDEIGDLSADIQIRLLRVLQTREFERVGGSDTLGSDFRLIVATNRDLEKEVKTQKFRADLYFRLAVFPLYVPTLRERREDIPLLANHFLSFYSRKMSKEISKIRESEMEKLLHYNWPGNVRELENIIERGTILSKGTEFRVPELSYMAYQAIGSPSPERANPIQNDTHVPENGDMTLKGMERQHIVKALRMTNWKVRGPRGAAEILDIHPSTLAFRMKKLGIQRPKTFRRVR